MRRRSFHQNRRSPQHLLPVCQNFLVTLAHARLHLTPAERSARGRSRGGLLWPSPFVRVQFDSLQGARQ